MNETNLDVAQALKDIALIRRVLNKSERQSSATLDGVTMDANLLIQAGVFALAVVLLITEVFTNSMTETLASVGQSGEMAAFGVGFMAFIVLGLTVVLYFVLWRAARYSGEEFNTYLFRNFRYVQNLSFISDLLMKFATLSLIMLAGKPQWVAPLLIAFTGDYLLQGRLFTLPTKVSTVLGALCLAAAFAQFWTNFGTLVVPLVVFSFVAGLSTAGLVRRYKRQASANA